MNSFKNIIIGGWKFNLTHEWLRRPLYKSDDGDILTQAEFYLLFLGVFANHLTYTSMVKGEELNYEGKKYKLIKS